MSAAITQGFNSQPLRARRVQSHEYARGARVFTRSPVNHSNGEDRLWHAIILRSLHMAVIGDVNSEALYPASDPFRSTP